MDNNNYLLSFIEQRLNELIQNLHGLEEALQEAKDRPQNTMNLRAIRNTAIADTNNRIDEQLKLINTVTTTYVNQGGFTLGSAMKISPPTLPQYVPALDKTKSNANTWISETFQKLEASKIPHSRWFNCIKAALPVALHNWADSTAAATVHANLNDLLIGFKAPFIAHEVTPAFIEKCKENIQQTKQGLKSLRTYIQDFNNLKVNTGAILDNDEGHITAFIKGLIPSIKKECKNRAIDFDRPWISLQELQTYALKKDPDDRGDETKYPTPLGQTSARQGGYQGRFNPYEKQKTVPTTPITKPKVPPTPKTEFNECRLCLSSGTAGIPFTHSHYRDAHPRLNNLQVHEKYEEEQNLLDKFMESFDEEPSLFQMDNKSFTSYSSAHLAPIAINGKPTTALVDSGANISFMTKSFAESLKLEFIPAPPDSTFDRGGKPDSRIGSVKAILFWAELTLPVKFEILDNSDHDVIIGRSIFPELGISLFGIPIKPPGPQVTEVNDFLPLKLNNEEINPTDFENLDPRLKEALEKNALIPPYSTTSHPLGPIRLNTTEEVTHWSRKNYVKPQDLPRVREIVQQWVKEGI